MELLLPKVSVLYHHYTHSTIMTQKVNGKSENEKEMFKSREYMKLHIKIVMQNIMIKLAGPSKRVVKNT